MPEHQRARLSDIVAVEPDLPSGRALLSQIVAVEDDDDGNALPSGLGAQWPPSRIDQQRAWSMSPARDAAAARRGQPPAPPMATEAPTDRKSVV